MPVDLIDKQILYTLLEDARISYRAIGRKLGLSVTAVRNRILKMEKAKVIRRYFIIPSYAMLDASFFTAILTLKHHPPSETFRDFLGAYPMINNVNLLADGNVMVWGKYVGPKELDELTLFLHELDDIREVEFHTILIERGKRCLLTSMQLQVLRCLRENVRMPIKDIAQHTGMTQRRIRKLLTELIGTEGSADEQMFHENGIGDYRTAQQCFHTRTDGDVAEGGATRFYARTEFQGGDETRRSIVALLKRTYPMEYWFTHASASAPVLFSMFLVDIANYSPEIIKRIKELEDVVSVRPIVYFAHHYYPGLNERFWQHLLG